MGWLRPRCSDAARYFEYDALNRQIEVRDALGNATAMVYDASGNQTALLDARGGVSYYYDTLNRQFCIRAVANG